MQLGRPGDAGERCLQHQGADLPARSQRDGHSRPQRLPPQHEPAGVDPCIIEKIERRFAVGEQPGLGGLAGVAGIAAVFRHEHAVALAGEAAQAPGAIADMAAIAVKIDDDRPAGARRQTPREQAEPIACRQHHLAHPEQGQIAQIGTASVGAIEQLALTQEKPGGDGAIGGKPRSEQRIEHGDGDNDQAAGNAVRSRAGWCCRTLADLSWPQAARISRPRGVRTGAE